MHVYYVDCFVYVIFFATAALPAFNVFTFVQQRKGGAFFVFLLMRLHSYIRKLVSVVSRKMCRYSKPGHIVFKTESCCLSSCRILNFQFLVLLFLH